MGGYFVWYQNPKRQRTATIVEVELDYIIKLLETKSEQQIEQYIEKLAELRGWHRYPDYKARDWSRVTETPSSIVNPRTKKLRQLIARKDSRKANDGTTNKQGRL
jgi:hypothetical protein